MDNRKNHALYMISIIAIVAIVAVFAFSGSQRSVTQINALGEAVAALRTVEAQAGQTCGCCCEGNTTIQAQCKDRTDNDADGLIDYPQDPGCTSLTDNNEFNGASTPQCRDGVDNDGDSAIDMNDPGCSSPEDNTEQNDSVQQCRDVIDNDGDGLVDFPQDPGCTSLSDNDETNAASQCSDSQDNDNDGATDYPTDFSCSSSSDNDESNPRAQCQDTVDNDQDGFVDLADPGCASWQDNEELGGGTQDFGWTQFTPRSSARIVYVSSSGDDSTGRAYAPSEITGDPFNPTGTTSGAIRPYRTIGAAMNQIRHGEGDWLLLKRGDTFNHMFGSVRKGGHSEQYPLLFASYGNPSSPRPIIQASGPGTLMYWQGCGSCPPSFNHIAIVGLHLKPTTGSGREHAIKYNYYGTNFLVEDNYIDGFEFNLNLQGVDNPTDFTDVRIRRNVIANAWKSGSSTSDAKAQGIFTNDVSDLLLEENIFYHNGWKESDPSAMANIFNHNAYIQYTTRDLVAKGNLFIEGASHGLQARDGGIVEDNFFLKNAIALNYGNENDHPDEQRAVSGTVKRNVVLLGRDIDNPNTGLGGDRGYGFDIQHVSSAVISDNVLMNNQGGAPIGIRLFTRGGRVVRNTVVENNVLYNWGALKFCTNEFCNALETAESNLNIDVRNNNVQLPNRNEEAVFHSRPFNAQQVEHIGNNYHSMRSSNEWFRIGDTRYNLANWQSNSESSATGQRSTFTDSQRTVESYMVSLGRPATYNAFIQELLGQRKGSWEEEFEATSINAYFRQGLACTSGC